MVWEPKTDNYDFDVVADIKRFIEELVKPNYDEVVAERGSATIICCGMETLAALHRVMEDREYAMTPIGRFFDADDKPRDLAEGELRLEWSGAEDNSWAIL